MLLCDPDMWVQDRNVVILPLQMTHGRRNRQVTFHILRRFEFESSLMRSGVVAVEHHKGQHLTTGVLIVRGTAAAIENMIGSDRLPSNYRKVTCSAMPLFFFSTCFTMLI